MYHADGVQSKLVGDTTCSFVIEDILEGFYKGKRYLHLIHAPSTRAIPPKPVEVKIDSVKSEECASFTLRKK